MKKNVFLSIVLLSIISTLSAQTISIKGKIVEKGITPLGFASVTLMQNDSSLVVAATSDENGLFILNDIKTGSYLLSISFLGYIPSTIELQNIEKSIDLGLLELYEIQFELNEVTIKASNVIQKIDRQVILPTSDEIKRSSDTYDLLNNMMIARLQVDPVSKTLAVSGGGKIQVRVNGIEVQGVDFASILAKDIIRVEFIENPGKRYGDNTGAVVNIITKRQESGGQFFAQLSNSPFVLWGENYITTKYHKKKSEWSLNYNNRNRGYTERHRDITEKFNLLNDTIERVQEGINDKNLSTNNNINVSYNIVEPNKYTFNAMFRNQFTNVPYNNRSSQMIMGEETGISKIKFWETNYTPSLDLYYDRLLPRNQELQFNLVGTLIDSKNGRIYNETGSIQNMERLLITSNVYGRKYSVIGEGVYTKTYEHIQVNTGIRYFQMYAKNKYEGTVNVSSEMDQSELYSFAELQGRIKNFAYLGGVSLNRSYFSEGGKDNIYYTFSPIIRLGYPLMPKMYINYIFNVSPSVPRLDALTNVEQALDSIQIVRGNPALRTYRIYTNNLTYSYSQKIFQGSLSTKYLYYENPIMESIYERNGKVVFMDENQKYYSHFNVEADFRLKDINVGTLPKFFSIDVNIGYSFYSSEGNSYKHDYNDLYVSIMPMLTYKNFTLTGQYRKFQNILYGETIKKGTDATLIVAMYKKNNFQAGLIMMYPFTNNYKTGYERLSDIAPAVSWDYVKEAGRLYVMRLSYNFEFGKKHETKSKSLNNADSESGIIKLEK
ncbi:hypothetical protein FACS189432_02790 [Bacteroidia bacterium]|nr:hypothetical protein FACS189432_02790 [Bacteroidia bacterium]